MSEAYEWSATRTGPDDEPWRYITTREDAIETVRSWAECDDSARLERRPIPEWEPVADRVCAA